MSLWIKSWTLWILLAIVAASAAQAVWWVFLVPIYQSPDEPAHLDYALALHAHRGLLLARHAKFTQLPTDAHSYTPYLRERAAQGQVTFNYGAKMPPDYGTSAYFEALDREAPPPAELRPGRPCQLASLYPFGYYAVLACWMEMLRTFDGGIVTMFFGARLFSVVLLSISLCLIYATVRLLGHKPAFALLVTALIGTFPLTSFVASYVQPDNLSFTLVSAAFYLSLRAKTNGLTIGGLLLLGAAMGGLLVTKVHFWLCVTPAVFAMIAAETAVRPAANRRWLRTAAVLVLPSILLGGVWVWTVWGTENYFAPRDQSLDRLTRLVRLTRQALDDFFAGTTHVSFWGAFGWLDTPLKFHDQRMTETIALLVQAATYGMLGLTLLRLEQVVSRLVRVAWSGRAKTAVRIAASNPAMNSYFLFAVFMLGLYVWTSNRFGAQGRNWFPYMLPIVLTGLTYAPKALTLRRSRQVLTGLAAAGLLAYGIVGNHYARASIRERFYFLYDGPMAAVAFPCQPTDLNDMTWDKDNGSSTGHDPYAIFALDRPAFVYGLRVRFTVTHKGNEPVHFQLFWKKADENFSEYERNVRYDVVSGEEKTLDLWINSDISHFRIDPDSRPCRFEIHEITLKQEPADNRARQADGSRRRSH
jgi:hypothetical protein